MWLVSTIECGVFKRPLVVFIASLHPIKWKDIFFLTVLSFSASFLGSALFVAQTRTLLFNPLPPFCVPLSWVPLSISLKRIMYKIGRAWLGVFIDLYWFLYCVQWWCASTKWMLENWKATSLMMMTSGGCCFWRFSLSRFVLDLEWCCLFFNRLLTC